MAPMLESWKAFLPPRAIVMGKSSASAPQALGGDPIAERLGGTLPQNLPEQILSEKGTLPRNLLQQISSELKNCTRCKLCEKRKTVVVGEGNPRARLVFVGEGPGEQEDIQGRPFVGKAGQLLDKMIGAMGLSREDVMILNVVKCRPPGNRNPEPDEIEACSPFLYRQLDAIQPEVIVALGKFAAQTLLKTEERISSLRGRFHALPKRDTKLMPTFHPAFLLRNPESKREAWEDLKKVADALALELPKK
jgi:uracil-DNA glycosylase family 4